MHVKTVLILPNWHSPVVLCQYGNVPETAEQVVSDSAWERSREQGCTGDLGMKEDERVRSGRGAGKGRGNAGNGVGSTEHRAGGTRAKYKAHWAGASAEE